MNKIHISYDAKMDLAEIKDYISSELANPQAAVNTITRIMKEIRMLQDFAYAGAKLSSVTDVMSNYRYLVIGNYMAFYRVSNEDVFIDRVLYGRSNYMQTLFWSDEISFEQ